MSKDYVPLYIYYPPRLSVSEIIEVTKEGHRANHNENSRI